MRLALLEDARVALFHPLRVALIRRASFLRSMRSPVPATPSRGAGAAATASAVLEAVVAPAAPKGRVESVDEEEPPTTR